jgi:energy-coupling factor transport system ATP-binding protein
MIRLDKVSFAYQQGSNKNNKNYVIKDITLEINQGEAVAIIGPNGSGKSTLAKLLNALLIPTKGQIFVDNLNTKVKANQWDIRKKVGLVFQNPDNQLVASSVEEEVAFGPENIGMSTDDLRRAVERTLKIVGLEDLKNESPHNLSGGQKQRLAIASVLAMNPRYIVLDEATSMLDKPSRNEIIKYISDVNKNYGIGIIHITHDISEAVFCNRVLVMNDGRFILDGTPADVFGEEELLVKIGLGVPGIYRLANNLKKAGLPISKKIIDRKQMVKELCSLILDR